MSMESDLYSALAAICPQVYPDVAPFGTVTPYITWQGLGGRTMRMLDNSAGDKRHTLMQINVWAIDRPSALTMIRQIEGVLCASGAFIATPEGEPLSTYEDDTKRYGSLQRFSIISAR